MIISRQVPLFSTRCIKPLVVNCFNCLSIAATLMPTWLVSLQFISVTMSSLRIWVRLYIVQNTTQATCPTILPKVSMAHVLPIWRAPFSSMGFLSGSSFHCLNVLMMSLSILIKKHKIMSICVVVIHFSLFSGANICTISELSKFVFYFPLLIFKNLNNCTSSAIFRSQKAQHTRCRAFGYRR